MERLCLQCISILLLQILGARNCNADKAATQIQDWKTAHNHEATVATNQRGVSVPSLTSSQSRKPHSPILLQDSNLMEHIAHFNRERIPERVIHAKGAGAMGFFEVTHDITKWTKAAIFSQIGKKTPAAIRFSTSVGERGSADTVQDTRGMAIKLQSEEGVWDLTCLTTENFSIRDPLLLPSLIHVTKRNPQTNLHDHNMLWDFYSLRPESTLNVLLSMTERAIPDGYRHIDTYAINAFKMINSKNEAVYVKFHWKPSFGMKNLNITFASRLAGTDPDYATRDLFNAIAEKSFPIFGLFIQIMTFEEARLYKWDPFDATKVWLKKDFPLFPVGKLILNQNPTDYHSQVEQLAFSPSNLIPGIEISPDHLLQGRFLAYPDAQLYRLGTNYFSFPANAPVKSVKVNSYVRDGVGRCSFNGIGNGSPNYFPNSFNGPSLDESNIRNSVFYATTPDVVRANADELEEDHFSQAVIFWKETFTQSTRNTVFTNLAASLSKVTDQSIISRAINNWERVSPELAKALKAFVLNSLKVHS